jgi:RNA polymerase sigma factor (sigma-70 family)
MESDDTTVRIGNCLARLASGDARAGAELMTCAGERLQHLVRKMLHGDFERLRRWEETADVYQNAMLRLHRSLEQVVLESPLHFYRFSAQIIRRELLDLARHYYGPEGPAANHASGALVAPGSQDSSGGGDAEPIDPRSAAPRQADETRELHERVDLLPEPEKTVVDLIVYQGLPQTEVARLLEVDVRSVQRYWQKARIQLYEAIHRG